MNSGFAAPNINLDNPIDEVRDLNMVTEAKDADIKLALSNSFGFGGTNSAIIIKKVEK